MISLRRIVLLVAILILASPVAAQRTRQISEFTVNHVSDYVLDDAGSIAFFVSTVDPFGTNPDNNWQIFKKSLPGGSLVQVTSFAADSTAVSVSDDGTTILFVSNADPLDTNTDGSTEVYLADSSGGSLVQLTDHPYGGGDTHLAVISGDGSRALFVSDGNLGSLNPLLLEQLFVIDTDGTDLVQLTRSGDDGYPEEIAISDDGSKAIFTDGRNLTMANADGSRELFKVLATGGGLRQVTANSEVYGATLSGNGATIAYSDDGELYSVTWDPGAPQYLDDIHYKPSITDDGGYVYYTDGNPRTVFKIASTGGTPVSVWDTSEGWSPAIAGSGTCLLFQASGEDAPFITNPDAIELLATDQDGLSPEQLVDVGEFGNIWTLEMTADGRWIVFPWGDGIQDDGIDLFLADVDSDGVSQLTDRAGAIDPDISDDGTIIVFLSELNLVDDGCVNDFGGTYRISSDGSGLQRLIPNPITCPQSMGTHAMISGNGSTVVHQDAGDPAGTDTGGGSELYGVSGSGGSVWQVTNDDDATYRNPRIDGSGTWVVYQSQSDITGQNPDTSWEVFRIESDGSNIEQLTVDPNYISMRPDISADGGLIVYASEADPLGSNADHNLEIFLYDVSEETTEQLTVTSDGYNFVPRISPNGAYVAFYSTSIWFDSSGPIGTYLIDLGTDEVEYVSAGCGYVNQSNRNNVSIDVDDDGNVAFVGLCDPVGTNRDGSLELWLSEFDIPSFFDIGDVDLTVLSWDPLPWAIRYDVIRGDVANLAPGGGGTVDLGAVVCVENDSEDALTKGDEDALQPSPGQVLFYLYRDSRGDLDGPGSYGQGTGDAERVPSSGGCPDAP